jgi:hypothetical protein
MTARKSTPSYPPLPPFISAETHSSLRTTISLLTPSTKPPPPPSSISSHSTFQPPNPMLELIEVPPFHPQPTFLSLLHPTEPFDR